MCILLVSLRITDNLSLCHQLSIMLAYSLESWPLPFISLNSGDYVILALWQCRPVLSCQEGKANALLLLLRFQVGFLCFSPRKKTVISRCHIVTARDKCTACKGEKSDMKKLS